MGIVLTFKNADFYANSINKESAEKVKVEPFIQGVYNGTPETGVKDGIATRADRISSQTNTKYEYSLFSTIELDLSTYKYLVVYRDSSGKIIEGSDYFWEESSLNYKNSFTPPLNAKYIDFSIARKDGANMSTDSSVINLYLVE